MASSNDIVKQRQCVMRREMDRRGISLKAVSFDSGVPYSTLLSYFPEAGGREPALMSVAAQYSLCGALPDDILSLLLPDGRLIVRVPEGIDHDEIDRRMAGYRETKAAAHHPDSPAGRDIADCEDKALRAKLTLVASAAA